MFNRLLSLASRKLPNAHVVAMARVRHSIYIGTNSFKTSPSYFRRMPNGVEMYTEHAEMNLLKKLRGTDLSKVVIYVFRFMANDELGMSRPCQACQTMLKNAGVKPRNVFFTDKLGNWQVLNAWE